MSFSLIVGIINDSYSVFTSTEWVKWQYLMTEDGDDLDCGCLTDCRGGCGAAPQMGCCFSWCLPLSAMLTSQRTTPAWMCHTPRPKILSVYTYFLKYIFVSTTLILVNYVVFYNGHWKTNINKLFFVLKKKEKRIKFLCMHSHMLNGFFFFSR